MANVTYSLSVNSTCPDVNTILYGTTSITKTTYQPYYDDNVTYIYKDTITRDYLNYTLSANRFNLYLSRISNVTNVDSGASTIRLECPASTLSISCDESIDNVSSTFYSLQYSNGILPPFKMIKDNENADVWRASNNNTFTRYTATGNMSVYTISIGTQFIVGYQSPLNETLITSTSTASLNNSSYSFSTVGIMPVTSMGASFTSAIDSNGNILFSSTSFYEPYYTRYFFSTSATYTQDENNIYQLSSSSSSRSWDAAGRLELGKINSTSWWDLDSYTSWTVTKSIYGLCADTAGNIYRGMVSGIGPTGYNNPVVVTAFESTILYSTTNTSAFSSTSTLKSQLDSTSTGITSIEFNNYGVGGTITSSSYTWNVVNTTVTEVADTKTSSQTISMIRPQVVVTISHTLTDNINCEVSNLDNYCPYNSSTSYLIGSVINIESASTSSTSYVISETISSTEINRTSSSYSVTQTIEGDLIVYNDHLSTTEVYSASTTITDDYRVTTFIETISTSSCEVTSYTNLDGYSYYTTFYGELGGEYFYGSSWEYSAEQYTYTGSYADNLTQCLYTKTYKTFGDPVSSTTLSQIESSIKVYTSAETTVSRSRGVEYSESEIVHDGPYETHYTSNTTYYTKSTYRTYIGPSMYNLNKSMTLEGLEYTYSDYLSDSSSSSTINTVGLSGTTYRLSELITSISSVNLGANNVSIGYSYNYDIKSMYSLNNNNYTLDNYTTLLSTSFTDRYDGWEDYDDYTVTKSTSWAVRSTGPRFIDRVELSATTTSYYDATYTSAIYNYDITIDAGIYSTILNNTSEQRTASTVSQTFISSSDDLSSTINVIDLIISTTSRGSFINSMRELVSTTTEQQNDTLIFASTFNTYSYYNNTYITSTVNTVGVTEEATTYTEWYDPISWSHTYTSVATSSSAAETVQSASGSVSVTQSIDYTPIYTSTDGIYLTA